MIYYFDIEKCKCCPHRKGCYKEGAKKKTYSETIVCDAHSEQAQFQETEYFKEKMKERYKIEAKNNELKHRHGYDIASSSGLIGTIWADRKRLFSQTWVGDAAVRIRLFLICTYLFAIAWRHPPVAAKAIG